MLSVNKLVFFTLITFFRKQIIYIKSKLRKQWLSFQQPQISWHNFLSDSDNDNRNCI